MQKLLKLLEGKDMIEYSVGEKKEVNIPSDTQVFYDNIEELNLYIDPGTYILELCIL